MQSEDDSMHMETQPSSPKQVKEVAIGSDGKRITIKVGSKTTIIQNNTTTDRELFEALCYEPFCRYEVVREAHDGVANDAFEEFYRLMKQIVQELNKIERRDM